MTKKSQANPCGVPFGINICSGHPQPQKLNCSSAVVPAAGRLLSKFLKVRSNGIVTVDSLDRLRTVFCPGRTEKLQINE